MRYRTIVADPPWRYKAFGSFRPDPNAPKRTTPLAKGGRYGSFVRGEMPYPMLDVDAIAALPVAHLGAPDSHLYLWTTQRYLWDAARVVAAWGYAPSCVLTWCKPAGGFHGGTFVSNTEFIIFARRGRLSAKRREGSQWHTWPTGGNGSHSRKPEAFLDLVESVSPGPYLELFARRQRLGWDTWGDEALGHVEIA